MKFESNIDYFDGLPKKLIEDVYKDYGTYVAYDFWENEVASINSYWVYNISDKNNVKKMRKLVNGEIKFFKENLGKDTIFFEGKAGIYEENNKLHWDY